jgi:hypothetical protein
MAKAERKAKNEVVFREVNERIESAAVAFGVPGEASFVCECGDATCTEMVHLTLSEYGEIRSNGRRFAIIPGHEDPAVERVVGGTRRFTIVEKIGKAGAVAEAVERGDD